MTFYMPGHFMPVKYLVHFFQKRIAHRIQEANQAFPSKNLECNTFFLLVNVFYDQIFKVNSKIPHLF